MLAALLSYETESVAGVSAGSADFQQVLTLLVAFTSRKVQMLTSSTSVCAERGACGLLAFPSRKVQILTSSLLEVEKYRY